MTEQNPYAAPAIDHQASMPYGPSGTWVRQVRIVAMLMLIQGLLELLFGGYLITMSYWFPILMAQQPNQMPVEQQQMFNRVMYAYFGIGGAVSMFIGLLRIVSGILGFQFRGRLMGIISNLLGIVIVFTIYCMPTAIALCVYGCIVYFNREVTAAFRMRKQGSTIAEIMGHFRL